MGRVLAIVNQKGGVGKTTTAVSLASALAIFERPTLLVDADPQSNATRALGLEADPDRPSLYQAFHGSVTIEQIKLTVDRLPCLHLAPAEPDLVGLEIELVEREEREYQLKKLLELERSLFDFVIIDCPPSLGMLTLNALCAADGVIVPVQAEYLALEGISQLIRTVDQVREALNPDLEIQGVLMTMFDDRTNLAKQVVDEVRDVLGPKVFRSVIPRNVRLAEAPSHGQSIFHYDVRSKGAYAYLELAKELIEHEAQGVRQGAAQPHPGDHVPGPEASPSRACRDGGDDRGSAADRSGPDQA